MKSVIHAIVIVASAVLPIVNAITPEGMLAAPRRGVALANPSGVGPVLALQSRSLADQAGRTLPCTQAQITPLTSRKQPRYGNS